MSASSCVRCGYPTLRDGSCSDACEPTEADLREDQEEYDLRVTAQRDSDADGGQS